MFAMWFFFILLSSTIITTGAKLFEKKIGETGTNLAGADFKRAKELGNQVDKGLLFNGSKMYREELLEGDILETPIDVFEDKVNEALGRPPMYGNAARRRHSRWPGGEVPYEISSSYNAEERAVFAAAIQDYHKYTCVKFKERIGSDSNYVIFIRGDGCSSYIGKVGGEQIINIGDGCIHKGIIVHEMMHAIGFYHEQSRADRNDHVRIIHENIRRGQERNFVMMTEVDIDHLGTAYDYKSVMHYARVSFSNNGQATIIPLKSDAEIGQREGFSQNDIVKINLLYNCSKAPQPGPTPQPTPPSQPGPTPQPKQDCKDDFGEFMCKEAKPLCARSSQIQMNCAKTCNACDQQQCKDESLICASAARLKLCSHKEFHKLCAKTCLICS